MSLHYLVDGYNIIKQAPAFADQTLEDGRAGLLRWIDAHRPHGSVNNRVTVVFDGKPDRFGSLPAGAAQVIFARTESADDRIKVIVEQSAARTNLVVVSDDKGITFYVRSLGAKIMGVKQFAPGLFETGRTSSKRARTQNSRSGKYISLTKAEQINKEMERIWLKS